MAKVKYTIKTVVRRRRKNEAVKYWTLELNDNLEVDLGAELQTDLHLLMSAFLEKYPHS